MLAVTEARSRILAKISVMGSETVSLSQALGRVLAKPVIARLTQPPIAVSAMDGYAVRTTDLHTLPTRLAVVGETAAGGPLPPPLNPGEAFRIFTGAPLPPQADAVIIQEDISSSSSSAIHKNKYPTKGWIDVTIPLGSARFIRSAGLDFMQGDMILPIGKQLNARDIGLAAALNYPWLTVKQRPRIALLATGGEIVQPGEPVGASQIVSSNIHALAALVQQAGGIPINLGIAPDQLDLLQPMIFNGSKADLLVTTGGASVGDHDLMQQILQQAGNALDFWRIAMRPGKPLMFGHIQGTTLLGLPGNPVSSYVCACLFLLPIIRHMQGLSDIIPACIEGRLTCALPANDRREDYLRARFTKTSDGILEATPFMRQDSSMLQLLSQADGLAIRSPHAAAAAAGDSIQLLPFSFNL